MVLRLWWKDRIAVVIRNITHFQGGISDIGWAILGVTMSLTLIEQCPGMLTVPQNLRILPWEELAHIPHNYQIFHQTLK